MSRPLLLDLFCGGGGAAMGYYRAGFDVVGVDIKPQPLYPFSFVCMDALAFLRRLLNGETITVDLFRSFRLSDFTAVHLSPPCQAYCALRHMPNAKAHPELVDQSRDLAELTGLPFVIENVPGSPLRDPVTLCGTMFGLRTECGAELRRHRLFETNWPLVCGLACAHHSGSDQSISVTGTGMALGGVICVTGHTANDHAAIAKRRKTISVHGASPRDETVRWNKRVITVIGSQAESTAVGHRHVKGANNHRETFSVDAARCAMGIEWLPMSRLSQAIPPAYTQFIGEQLRCHL